MVAGRPCNTHILQVVVVGGAYAAKHAKLRDELAQLGGPARSQIILLDPDQEGRKARLLLADMFPEALHAFVPWDLAQASKTSRQVNLQMQL